MPTRVSKVENVKEERVRRRVASHTTPGVAVSRLKHPLFDTVSPLVMMRIYDGYSHFKEADRDQNP